MRFRMTSACLLPVVLAFSAALQAESFSRKVDPWVLQKSSAGTAEFLVMLRTQGDLRGARALSSKTERSAFVMDALRSVAEQSQKPLLDLLASRGVPHRSYWVANMIWVRGDRSLVEELAAREDVFHIYANPSVRLDGPVASSPAGPVPTSPDAIEWGVAKVHAPEAWALGFTGEGIVVGGQDTGYEWDHRRDQEQVPGLAGPRLQPQLQLARFDPLRRRLLRPRLSRAVRRPLPRHAHDGHDGRRRRRLQPDRRRARGRSGSAAAT